MAEERKPNPIIRREKFVVDHTEINDFGDMIVTSKSSIPYKIGKKREKLFATFQPNTEVVVGYAVYKDREYIAEATPSTQVVSVDTPIEKEKVKPQEQTKSGGYRGKTPEELITERRSIERQTSLKLAVEMAALDTGETVLERAEIFYNWISKGEIPQPITKDTPQPESATASQIDSKSGKEEAFDKLASAGKPAPKSVGELYAWVSTHLPKGRLPKDFILTCGVTEEQLKTDIPAAYQLVRQQNLTWKAYEGVK